MNVKDEIYGAIDRRKVGHTILESRHSFDVAKQVDRILNCEYTFDNRSRGCDKLCIVLAGYKPPLWSDVFFRLGVFLPDDVDVCIMTSGLTNPRLSHIAEQNGWSYLATGINHLSHIQNLAIELHPEAQWIYKIDEDMFLTQGFFENLLATWRYAEEESLYIPAFVSPLINVNCYGHLRLLQKLDLIEDFRNTGLTDMKIAEGLRSNQRMLEDPAVARYLWGETQPVLRDIDALTARFSAEPLSFTVCPVRFSIGAILFSRQNWAEFGGFPVTFVGSEFGLGDDEEHIGSYAFFHGKSIIVSENNVAGHLGYGPQTASMVEFYKMHREWFALDVPEA